MASCSICGKSTSVGVSQRHRRGVAGRRWAKRAQETKRLFMPNIQTRTLVIAGETQKMRLCTSCLKRIKKSGSVGKYKTIALA